MCRCALSAALTLFAVAGVSPAPAQEKHALLVGINNYQDEINLKALRWSEADVTALAAVLKKAGYSVTVLTDSAKGDNRATKANIERALKDMLKRPQKNRDTVLIAFSGHGVQFEKKVATDPEDAYFCPVDARPFRDERFTMVSLSSVYYEMKKSHAGTKVLLVDACRSDPDTTKSSKGGVSGEGLPPPEEVAALFSCKQGERAWEYQKLGHGVFFHHVLEALRGDVRAPDGEVSLTFLAGYVMKRVPKTVKSMVGDSPQTPHLKTNISNDPILLIQEANDKPPLTPIVKPPVVKTPIVKTPGSFKNTIDMELVLIPEGTFLMGSPRGEVGRGVDETQHRVEISTAFYMGKFPVTVKQFRAFAKANPYQTETERDDEGAIGFTGQIAAPFARNTAYSWRKPGFKQGDSYPVVNVTWNDAQAFCKWLGEEEGKTYRLPTEAEWEYACRAGTTTRFSCGDDERDLITVANIGDQAFKRLCVPPGERIKTEDWNDGYAFTAPMDEPNFRANRFGLSAMHGNVWQWCSDWYDARYYQSSPSQDPKGPGTRKQRVMRGGSWMNPSETCRSAKRDKNAPNDCFPDLGFRVICVVPAGAP